VVERLFPLFGSFLLALAIVVGSVLLAGGIRDRGKNDVMTVTGSAKKRVVADYVIWNGSVSSQRASPAAAVRELDAWAGAVRSFLRQNGVEASELTVQPISTETVTSEDFDGGASEVAAYRLTRSFEVRSARVDAISAVAEQSAVLIRRGIPFAAEPPQYVYTKLADLRPELLAEATQDAQNRAEVLVDATGADLGDLRGVNVGVFQVTSPNSTEVSDYGVYDTSTLQKDVTAVVNVTFALS
jgi:hypothetical protein